MNSRKPGTAADLDNRSRLLHAAADVFAEFGFEGASLRAIADTAGVSFQLIAYYFGSKEELWVATVDFLFERYLETGKGLGFTPSGNLAEQFHNHLRLLLTDMLQRPQLRKIWIAGVSRRTARAITTSFGRRSRHALRTLALPYLQEVVRLGIVERFTAEEIGLLFSCGRARATWSIPHFVEHTLGLPAGSPKSVERQIDLIFAILTERLDCQPDRLAEPRAPSRVAAAELAGDRGRHVVYPGRKVDTLAEATRVEAARDREPASEAAHR